MPYNPLAAKVGMDLPLSCNQAEQSLKPWRPGDAGTLTRHAQKTVAGR